MKRYFCILLALGLALLCACGTVTPELPDATTAPSASEPVTEQPTAEQTAPTELPSETDSVSGEVIFDFAELPEQGLPRGLWSVNDLEKQYGTATEALGTYLKSYDLVFPRAQFEGYYVQFAHTATKEFSLPGELKDMDIFPFSEANRALRMNVLLVRITDLNAQLPRGLRIGAAKAEVLAAYPADSGEPIETEVSDELFFRYEFRDDSGAFDGGRGHIAYVFEEGILVCAAVVWQYYDL